MGLNEKYTELKPEKAQDFLAPSTVWNPLFITQTQQYFRASLKLKALMEISTR